MERIQQACRRPKMTSSDFFAQANALRSLARDYERGGHPGIAQAMRLNADRCEREARKTSVLEFGKFLDYPHSLNTAA